MRIHIATCDLSPKLSFHSRNRIIDSLTDRPILTGTPSSGLEISATTFETTFLNPGVRAGRKDQEKDQNVPIRQKHGHIHRGEDEDNVKPGVVVARARSLVVMLVVAVLRVIVVLESRGGQ